MYKWSLSLGEHLISISNISMPCEVKGEMNGVCKLEDEPCYHKSIKENDFIMMKYVIFYMSGSQPFSLRYPFTGFFKLVLPTSSSIITVV